MFWVVLALIFRANSIGKHRLLQKNLRQLTKYQLTRCQLTQCSQLIAVLEFWFYLKVNKQLIL